MSLIPPEREVLGCHPRAVRREMSRSLRGVPSGFEESNRNSPRQPTTLAIVSAKLAYRDISADAHINRLGGVIIFKKKQKSIG